MLGRFGAVEKPIYGFLGSTLFLSWNGIENQGNDIEQQISIKRNSKSEICSPKSSLINKFGGPRVGREIGRRSALAADGDQRPPKIAATPQVRQERLNGRLSTPSGPQQMLMTNKKHTKIRGAQIVCTRSSMAEKAN